MSVVDFVFDQSASSSGDLVFGEIATGSSYAEITGSFQPLTAALLALPGRDAQITGSFQPLTAALLALPGRDAQITGSFAPLTAAIRLKGSTTVAITGAFQPLSVLTLIGKISDAQITGSFADLTVSAFIAPTVRVTITGSFPSLTASLEAAYSSNTARPTVNHSGVRWQTAQPAETGTQNKHQDTTPAPVGWDAFWQRALGQSENIEHRLPSVFQPNPVHTRVSFQDGTGLAYDAKAAHQDATRTPLSLLGKFQDGTPIFDSTRFRHQDGDHTKRLSRKVRYQGAKPLRIVRSGRMQSATPFIVGRDSRFQDAMRPPAGLTQPPQPPVVPPTTCYTPSPHLVFSNAFGGVGDLLFICDNYTPVPPGGTVVVPVRRVYIVLNVVNLRRVSDDQPVPTFGMSLSLDVGSWTWSFNATLPGSSLALVKPTDATITELKANINGTEFRVLAESVSRDRSFGQSNIRISGRGRNATLDSPYTPTQSFANLQERTAQQLMDDVLTYNNVSLGWTVNWGLEDWLVPAGAFSHQGTHISALNVIAKAAGGFLLPHASDKSFSVKPLYPVGPWDWSLQTPDFEIPADVAVQEGLEWLDKAPYNRVYVSGESVGVLGAITRLGTAGDVVAPMVVDPLITAGAAARQRGLAVLSDTGLQAHVTLRMPVLAETGILLPGHMIDYVDGATTRRGIVRSSQVNVQGSANIWQSVGLETHDV